MNEFESESDMIEQIHLIQYRKLENLHLEFSSGINVISGTNGTCKTSLLHIISNAFQKVVKKCEWLDNPACLEIINKVNSIINPKIESLTRGDKQHNDPAKGKKGTLFTINYIGGKTTQFRKHNSKTASRYAVKPYYKIGTKDSLPACPVIYLGLARLFPFGEFQHDEAIEKIKKSLPVNYQQEVTEIYKKLTGISIASSSPQKMGDIKVRYDFSSETEGIDSNTISAGEDNIFILITAIVSLKYYYQSIQSNNSVESILLIDELDATLHPSLLFKLLELFRYYSNQYKIQIIFTTHSLTLLEEALFKKNNVIYLIDNITSVKKMDTPDIYKIKMYLHSKSSNDIYINKTIPVFTEDNEARIFLNTIFDYFEENKDGFDRVRRFFHLVDANLGSGNLMNIFNDQYLIKSTMQAICILDGDQKSRKDYNKHIITLPGDSSPEELIMNYSVYLFESDSDFWTDEIILNLNYGKVYYRDNVRPDIDSIAANIQELKETDRSTSGVKRDLNKKTFLKHKTFFELLFKHWVNNEENKAQKERFYEDLKIMFKRVAHFYSINANLWN